MTESALTRLKKAVEEGKPLREIIPLANEAEPENPRAVEEIMQAWKMSKSGTKARKG